MVESKLIRVFDEHTNTVFMITKFEESDIPLLESTGWEISPELTMITHLGPQVSSAMSVSSAISKFIHPRFDIKERSCKMDVNHTSCSVAEITKNMKFEEIPDELDVRDVVIRKW